MKPCQFTTVHIGSGGGNVWAEAGDALNTLIEVRYRRPCCAISGQGGTGGQRKSWTEALT
jgi:GTPase involved in cell partitioning and DNA repair